MPLARLFFPTGPGAEPVAESNAVLTVLTGGLWAIVWIAATLGGRDDRVRYEVDRWGNVWGQEVSPA